MAEKLPGLIDPKLPPDQQPLHDSSNPNPAPPPPQPLRPDEFSPGAASTPGSDTDKEPAPDTQTKKQVAPHTADGNGGKPKPAEGSKPQTTPRRNP
jgi:hypothetical protein